MEGDGEHFEASCAIEAAAEAFIPAALERLEHAESDQERREWLRLIVGCLNTFGPELPRLVDGALRSVCGLLCRERAPLEAGDGQVGGPARTDAVRGALLSREDVAVLLIGLKRIVATVLRLYAGGVEQGEIDPTATIDEASAKGAADKKSSGGGSLSSANPFKFLSDFWSSSTKSAPVARREDPRQQAMAALVAHLTDVLEAVVAAYRAYPELRPRCEAVFIVLLPACAGDVLYAMARVARQRSLPRHEVNPSALLFLRSALELLHGSRRVNPETCVSVVTAVWSIAARHAAAEMTPGETTATGLHVALGATLRSTSTIEANAAVAAYSARTPAGRGTSKSTGASAGRSAARALEPSRLFPAAVFSTEALRERDMDLFLLYLLQIYLRLVPADGNALAEAVVPFFTLANVVFLSSSRPWSRVVLLSATAELMARVTLDTKLVPIDVAEQIRLLLEACVPVTNGDFEVSPAAVPEGSTEGDVRSYLTARALHQLGEVVCGLCEKAFVEERTVRRRHLRNATDPAFRALKAARLTPASVAVPSVSAEVFAALCGVLPPPPITTKRRDSPPDAAAPASVLRNWSVVAATEGAWMLQHVTSAAAHPQLLLSQAAPTSDDFEWSARALQERVVSALEDADFFLNKTRSMLRLFGAAVRAVMAVEGAPPIYNIGDSVTRSQASPITPQNLFVAKDTATDESHSLKRIAFVLFHCDTGEYLSQLRLLLRRLDGAFRRRDPQVSACCFLLLRVLLLRVQSEHLTQFRATMLAETMRALQLAGSEPVAALAALKFVDMLLLLSPPEFSFARTFFYVEQMSAEYDAALDAMAATSAGAHRTAPRHVNSQAAARPVPLLWHIAQDVDGLGAAVSPVPGQPVRLDAARFADALSGYESRLHAENGFGTGVLSASSTETLRAVRSYARALMVRSSRVESAFATPHMASIERWLETEFLTAPVIVTELRDAGLLPT
ncbi:hypothetical protein CDCA_CDCA12G3484 [Cyanidium caldarium]|uniref:DOP1-like C-terminal domain-containing protein n=1 Tax=Cyanidium caldarium TaxID=2771 RepID=A0AAV9IYT5_CYACA|nr:hypothetical protein CDCA_CDCA12G3484 [Cyanidium caldarium]